MARTDGINLAKVKKRNAITMKEILYKFGPISRNEIADMMELSLPTITTNIVDLIAGGLVEERDECLHEKDCGAGRRARPVDLVSNCRYFIGVEITRVRCTFCLTDLRFRDLSLIEEYRSNEDYEEMLAYVSSTIRKMVSNRPDIKDKILGVGVGLPGFVERKSGVLRSIARINWHDKPIRDDLMKRIGMRVCVENNVRVRSIGEDMVNGRIRPETFAYLFVSMGIGCALTIKNSVFTGISAGAGEMGHMVVKPDGPQCVVCGHRGCLDALSSETAILRDCRAALDEGKATILADIMERNGRLTMREVCQAQSEGDVTVCAIIENSIRYLAIGLANMANLISPNLVIVDAYAMKLEENRKLFMQVVKDYLFGLNDKEVAIEFKEYDRYAGCKGAAAFAIRQFFIRENQ